MAGDVTRTGKTTAGAPTGPFGPTTGGPLTGGGSARAARITQLGRYKIDRLLGVGGSASVFLAVDETIEKRVALKVLHEHLREDSVTLRRFANDARALARLNHANIAQVFAAELDQYYFAMELVEGPDLGRVLADAGALPSERAVGIALQMAEALEHIHDRNLVHRDVKPGNVLLAPGDRVKMTDFSVVQSSDETVLTLKGSLVGTVEYMSPEQIREEDADARADVYALGAVLYEMLVGRPPFPRPPGASEMWPLMERILKEPPPLACVTNPMVPRDLSEVVAKCLAKDPGERWQSMRELAEALRRILGRQATIRVVPVSLSEPNEAEGVFRLSWSPCESQDFEAYEVHGAAEASFVASDATRLAEFRGRTETEYSAPVPPAGGQRYYRIRTREKGGLASLSNRVGILHGRKPPVWKRPWFLPLAGVATLVVVASVGAKWALAPEPKVVRDRVRVSGRFAAAQFQQTGGFQFGVMNPETEWLERGSIAEQSGGSLGTVTVDLKKDQVEALDRAGFDLGILEPQAVTVEGTLAEIPGATGGIFLRPDDARAVVFATAAAAPPEVPVAAWKQNENRLIKITSTVLNTRNSGTSNVGYLELEGFQGTESVVLFRGVRSAMEGKGVTVEGLRGKRVSVIGKPSNAPRYGWQIVLARPEHLTVLE